MKQIVRGPSNNLNAYEQEIYKEVDWPDQNIVVQQILESRIEIMYKADSSKDVWTKIYETNISKTA